MDLDGVVRGTLRVANTVAPVALALGGGYIGFHYHLEAGQDPLSHVPQAMIGMSAGLGVHLLKEFFVDVWQGVQELQARRENEWFDKLEREGRVAMITYIPRENGKMTVITDYAPPKK